jgi:hypothetical protein
MPAIGIARSASHKYAGSQRLFWLMLCGGGAFSGWFLAVALVEAIDASRGIDQLLFAGEERVASRANFDVQVALLGRAGLECLAASAGNSYIDVFWVNSWFHLVTF